MRRRRFLAGVAAVAAWPTYIRPARAAPRLIGWLLPTNRETGQDLLDAFTAALEQRGYALGREIAIDARWADDDLRRLPVLARELVLRQPAVIVTATDAAVLALVNETRKVPIVFGGMGFAEESEFIAHFARPVGNVTGVIQGNTRGKLLELVRELLPGARRIALLQIAPSSNQAVGVDDYRRIAAALRLEPDVVDVSELGSVARAFEAIAARRVDAIILPSNLMASTQISDIAGYAEVEGLPLFSMLRLHVPAGALLSYGQDFTYTYRRVAALVAKILKGASPGEIPVERPNRYLLTVNLRAARSLGISIPPSILLRADRVIE